jgi:hypothetical protein
MRRANSERGALGLVRLLRILVVLIPLARLGARFASTAFVILHPAPDALRWTWASHSPCRVCLPIRHRLAGCGGVGPTSCNARQTSVLSLNIPKRKN